MQLERSCELFLDLESKFFVCKEFNEALLGHYSTRYRTKKRFLFESTSLHMMVVTHRCNQKCLYCHASAASDDSSVEIDMGPEVVEGIIDAIFESPSSYVKIEFQGGEPLLNFDAVKHAVRYAEEVVPNGRDVGFVICTNLTMLSDEQIEFINEHDIEISTSLDGPEALHNSCRLTKCGYGTYQSVVDGVNRLRHGGVDRVAALLTIHKGNVHRLKDVVDEYVARGFKSIFLRSMNPYGYAYENKNELSYSVETFLDAYIDAIRYIIEINRGGVDFAEEYASILLSRILTPFSCGFVDLQSPAGAAICGMVYETNGDVFVSDEARMLCRMTGERNFFLGNVLEDSRQEWFVSEKLYDILKDSVIESLPGCAWCAYSPYCGTDPVRNFFELGRRISIKPKDHQCQKNKAVFDFLMELLRSDDSFVVDLCWAWACRRPLGDVVVE